MIRYSTCNVQATVSTIYCDNCNSTIVNLEEMMLQDNMYHTCNKVCFTELRSKRDAEYKEEMRLALVDSGRIGAAFGHPESKLRFSLL